MILRYWKPVVIGLGVLLLLAGIQYAWGRFSLHRLVSPTLKQDAQTLNAIDQVQADSDAKGRAIEALAKQANALQSKADAADRARLSALAEARTLAQAASQAESRIAALEAQRRAQPVIRGLPEAVEAVNAAIR